jgi:hypothetical protein
VRRETQALLAVGPDIVRNLGEYTDDLRAIQARREKLGEAVEHLARCVGGRDGNASGVKG